MIMIMIIIIITVLSLSLLIKSTGEFLNEQVCI